MKLSKIIIETTIFTVSIIGVHFLPEKIQEIVFYSFILIYMFLNNSTTTNLRERIEDLETGKYNPNKLK